MLQVTIVQSVYKDPILMIQNMNSGVQHMHLNAAQTLMYLQWLWRLKHQRYYLGDLLSDIIYDTRSAYVMEMQKPYIL